MTETIKKWAPYLVFLVIYLSTSLIGTLLLLFGPELYWKLTYVFTGQTLPDIYISDLHRILALITCSILAITLGYAFGTHFSQKIKREITIFNQPDKNLNSFFATIIFSILTIYSFIKVFSIVDISSLSNWLVYEYFIEVRKLLFTNLSFGDFIIIYSMLPLFLAISLPDDIKNKRFLLISTKLLALVVINIYIFQKRPLAIGLLFIGFLLFVYYYVSEKPRLKLSKKLIPIIMYTMIILYLMYAVGIYVNTIGKAENVYVPATEKTDLAKLDAPKEVDSNAKAEDTEKKNTNNDILFKSFSLKPETIEIPKFAFTNSMAFIGMINRTAFSAISYPVVFPKYVKYFPVDIGQDLLGYGSMPNDALIVYDILNPQMKGNGSTAAPFFIVLYSQGGIVVATIGSLIVGLCLGFFWNLVLRNKMNNECGSGFGGLILLLSILLAMGSGRDSLLSAYGLIYPLICLTGFYAINYFIGHKRRDKKKANLRVVMLVTSGVINDSRILREAKIAVENGFEVLMIGRRVPELGEVDNTLPFEIKLIPIDRAAKSGILGKIIERIRIGLAFTAVAIRFKPDIVHANDFDTLPFGYLAALVCDSKLVYDSHEIWSENELVARRRFGKQLVKRLEGFLAKQSDSVISVSNASGEWLSKKYNLDNLTVVTNCPYSYSEGALKKNSEFELLCHGVFMENRGFEELIDCAKLVESEGITVALRGYGAKTEHYKKLVDDTGQKNIVMYDKVPPFDVIKAATASHVGVILTRPISISYTLTVSNKLFECINAGLPVILSDVPEHRYLNEKFKFGILLDEISAASLAEAAIRLKNDSKLYENLKQNALEASKVLCWENEGMKLISVYKNILQ